MAKDGLFILACASALLAATPIPQLFAADRDGSVADTLAVQTALQQSRDYLVRNNPKAAVETLERQLYRINGNAVYLSVLRDAYRAYIKELHLAHDEALAQKYIQLLAILEPPSSSESAPRHASTTPAAKVVSGAILPPAAPVSKGPTIRLKREEEDDFFRPSSTALTQAQGLLKQAEFAFSQSKYQEAKRLFDQAYQVDQKSTDARRDWWAYCKLHEVVDQLNQQSTAYVNLEREVKAALTLDNSSRIETFGKQLLGEIDKRRLCAANAAGKNNEPVAVRHLGRTAEGWSVAETTNFRIYFGQNQEIAEDVARTAERTRAEMQQKWFGNGAAPWTSKCDIFLFSTGQEYSRATNVPSTSPGHSSFQLDGSRVLSRRIDLHCDVPDMVTAVLPHEATHVVLAGNFGDQQVPRWADEGVAVLTEPQPKIDRHLRNLPLHRQQGQLLPLRQLVQMNDYPQPQRVAAFYAQSVSLVDFLSREKSPQVFSQFVRDGLRSGYEVALQRHYGYRSFEELDQRWQAFAFNEPGIQGVAQAPR
jgi:hypothetical protein